MEIYKANSCLNVKDASLLRSTVENADLTGTFFHEVRMTHLSVRDVDLSESSFDQARLAGSTFKRSDFANVAFERCQFDGATIDGIGVADLLANYYAR